MFQVVLGCIGGTGHYNYTPNNRTYDSNYFGSSGTGGLLIVYGEKITNNGNIVSCGTASTSATHASGGASGGGCVNILCTTYSGSGSYSAAGGSGGNGGAGGNGYAGVSYITFE